MGGKKLIVLGGFVGSIAGSYIPVLWGDSGFSYTSLLAGLFGAILGIWLAWRLAESFGE